MLLPFISETHAANLCTGLYTLIFSYLLGFSPDNEFNSQKEPEPEVYDFIIVGAGSAGSVVANRLSEVKDWKILLLEAGKEEPLLANIPGFCNRLANTEFDWNFSSQPENNAIVRNKTVSINQGKSMGGSSAINAMYYIRGNREDYDNWARMGNPGWSYDQVLPYFIKSENNLDPTVVKNNPDYHGTGGYLSVQTFPYLTEPGKIAISAFQEQGYNLIDPNAASQLGITRTQITAGNNSRSSANIAFIRPIRGERKNLFVKSQSLATKILIDPKTKTAIGVEYRSLETGETKTVTAKKEVIVSGGVVNSPKLLMVSGVGPRHELMKHKIQVIENLPVGRNFHDHVSVTGLSARRENVNVIPQTCEEKTESLSKYLLKREGPLTGVNKVMLAGFAKTEFEEKSVPDIQLNFNELEENEISIKPIILTPKSRGYIALNETDPVRGKPLIYAGYFTEKDDIERLIAGIGITIDILNSTVMRKHNFILNEKPLSACQPFKFNTYKYWLCFLQHNFSADYHFVGTCKMGQKKDNGVVDAKLKVHGIRGLRVIDSSIMPAVIRGNTNAPTIMIGEKGSDLIKEDWL